MTASRSGERAPQGRDHRRGRHRPGGPPARAQEAQVHRGAGDLRHSICPRRARSPTGSACKDALDDIEDLLRTPGLDAVVICSPNHLHESHILAALSANVHILVEKPLAMSAASVQRIMRAAEKRDRVAAWSA